MDFEGFKAFTLKGIEVAKLNRTVIRELATEKSGFHEAFLIVALSGVALAVGTFYLGGVLLYPVVTLVAFFINALVLHMMAAIVFRAEGSFNGLIQVLGASYVIQWVSAVPILGSFLVFFASFWYVVVSIVAIEEVYGLSKAKAVLSVLIPFFVLSILAGLMYLTVFGIPGATQGTVPSL